MGFHVHVMDFNYSDWTPYREADPIWCHHASRFKFTKLLQKQTYVFNRAHFNVSVDPMRVVTVPNTINAKTTALLEKIAAVILEIPKTEKTYSSMMNVYR